MHVQVMIACFNCLYAQRLTSYLTQSKENQFQIELFSNIDAVIKGLRINKYELILIDERVYEAIVDVITRSYDGPLLILTDQMTKLDTKKFQCVFMYQSAKLLENKMLETLLSQTKGDLVRKLGKQSKVVGFFGPSGGSGTTTMAHLFAHIKSHQDHKTLFLSLDVFASYDLMFEGDRLHNMSDYLVHLMTQNNWITGLKAMVSHDISTGIDFLKPVINQRDLEEVPSDLWSKCLKQLKSQSDYDLIVLDLRTGMSDETLSLLDLSDELFYVIRDDYIGQAKWQSFVRDMKALNKESIIESGKIILNVIHAIKTRSKERQHIHLEYDPSLYKRDREGCFSINSQSKVYKKLEMEVTYG